MSDDLNVLDNEAEEATIAADAVDDGTAILGEEVVSEAPSGTARLGVKRNGVEVEDSFELNPPCVIGRFDPGVGPVDVDLGPLPEGVYVSRKHARITCEDGVWSIEDLESSNGTFILLNGSFERVPTADLVDGTEFALGNARFIFHLS